VQFTLEISKVSDMVDDARLKSWLDRADSIVRQKDFDCVAALDLAREIRLERIYGVSWRATQAFIVMDKAHRRDSGRGGGTALQAFSDMREALVEQLAQSG
jgi:hypothetical protein